MSASVPVLPFASPDKREVLFSGSERVQEAMGAALHDAPPMTALEVVAVALDATAGFFGDNHKFARQRLKVIMANADLRERELRLKGLATAR